MTLNKELKSTINKNILLNGLNTELQTRLANCLQRRVVLKHDILYHQGDKADGLYFILSGEIQIFTQRDNEQIILSEASDHHLFGEFPLAGDSIRTTSASALEVSVLYYLSINDFHYLQQQYPDEMAIIGERIIKRLTWNETTLALRLSKLFMDLNDDIVRALINELDIRSIPSNHSLIKPDQVSKELFIVIHGRLQLKKKVNNNEQSSVINMVGRGEAICERNVIGEYHQDFEITAVRDSTVASLSQTSFEKMLQRYPLEINHTLVKSIISNLSNTSVHKRHSAETFAIIPLTEDIDVSELSLLLSNGLNKYGSLSIIDSERVEFSFQNNDISQVSFSDSHNDTMLQWLSTQENAHRYVIYIVDPTLSNWTRRCLRQADHLLFIAKADNTPDINHYEQTIFDEVSIKSTRKTLLLVHNDDTRMPSNSSQWLAPRKIDMHHHVRLHNQPDFDRVARFLTGNAVGLVLGGGGARGFAHIGVIRALQDLDIPIDLVGGNSMGAVVAAECAMQWDYDTMISQTKKLCIEGDEFTLPIVSLFSGNKITQNLKELFSNVNIEDLWHQFYSVSCNISRATIMTHKSGSLFSAVLNSNTPPGLFPPQVSNGDLLVDGALLNNVPVDVMRKYNEGGIIIAVDVNAREDLLNNTENVGGMSGWKLFLNKFNPMVKTIKYPNMIEILSRASIIGGLAQRKKMMNGIADLYLQPPVNKFSLRAYKRGDIIAQKGYEYAIKELSNGNRKQPMNIYLFQNYL